MSLDSKLRQSSLGNCWRNGFEFGSGYKLLLVVLMTCSVFVVPFVYLPWFGLLAIGLILHGYLLGASLKVLLIFGVVQTAFTLTLYLIFHTAADFPSALEALLRLFLAVVPAWWFAVAANPDQTASLLQRLLPYRWAFVVAASFNMLPFMMTELREIYDLQRLRGARISPQQLSNPKHWPEFVRCVLAPLLIQVIKLSQQLALAARSRHFGRHSNPTRWQPPKEME